jgi:iron-sulfur cluster repair protein YtfE (RIC family)
MTPLINGETITSYYEHDHDRLDELFKKYQSLKNIDITKSKVFFNEFKEGLQRHIRWEEEILFPLFEAKTGMFTNGPTEVMRMEHRAIEKYLKSINEKVSVANTATEDEEQMLLQTLGAHNEKEEQILYPMIDRSIMEQERDTVFQTMQKV